MSESFDSYNAPQFFDFSKDLHKEEDSDAYFEIDHENGGLEDPLKCEDSSSCKIQECINYNQNNSDIKLRPSSKYESSVEIKQEEAEEYIELCSSVSSLSGANMQDEATGREELRRSMSVGNLYPLSNSEHRDKTNISDVITVHHMYGEQKLASKNKSMNNLKKSVSNTCLNKNKAGPSHSSSPRLPSVASKDNINKLAQPKRYRSANNLDQSGYVSMAEAVKKFQSGTPTRFRSKPKLNHPSVGTKLRITVPQSPALLTKQRHRAINVLSREEQEQLEYEEAQKFKIKAHPLNKRVLQGPLKSVIPIEKKPITIPEPFKITAAPRKIVESPKKEIYEFHAKPVPKSLREPPKFKEIKKNLTKPQTPTFMKRYCKESVQQEQQEESKPSFKPLRTIPVPFSFDHRNQLIQKMKEDKINRVFEEEKKAREFHARPCPKAILHPAKNSSLNALNSASSTHPKGLTKSEENIPNQFKARPPTVLYKKPFEPKKEERHLIEITEFQLNTEMRAKEREEFEQLKREREERIALAKQLEEELRLRKEEEEVLRIRREAEYKAQPIKKYKEVKIQPSGKVTEPISPKFHINKHKSRENKENSNENLL